MCLQVAVPKAVLQQHCHKAAPRLPDPRFNKLSRPGEPFRYSCTITFPKPKLKKKVGGNGPAKGPKTWQLLESEDGWTEIQEAQNAVALKALVELVPTLTETHQLHSPFECARPFPMDLSSLTTPPGAAFESPSFPFCG